MTSAPLEPWQPDALAVLRQFANPALTDKPVPLPSILTLAALQRVQIDGLVMQGTDRTPLQRVYDRVWQAQRRAASRFAGHCAEQQIRNLIFKGADYLERYFDGRCPSILGDVDVLVERADLGATRALLYNLGYRQAKFDEARHALVDADIATIAAVEGVHYELYPFCKLEKIELDDDERQAAQSGTPQPPLFIPEHGEAVLCVELDVHHGIALDVDIAPLLGRMRASPFRGANALSPADSLWFTCSRLYTEVALHGKSTLRDFAYMIALLREEQIDWDCLLHACEEYQLRPALFYYLSFVNALFEQPPIPAAVLAELNPRHGSRMRDWGWQLAKIFDELDPFPQWAALSQPARTG